MLSGSAFVKCPRPKDKRIVPLVLCAFNQLEARLPGTLGRAETGVEELEGCGNLRADACYTMITTKCTDNGETP